MSQEQFQAIMPIICADLVAAICRERKVSEQDAIRLLYASRLYAALEDEQTKLWQYSTSSTICGTSTISCTRPAISTLTAISMPICPQEILFMKTKPSL